MECTLVDNDGTKAVVMCGHEKKTFKSSEIGQVNPPKFEKCEDMANLTFLNDASVLWSTLTRDTPSTLALLSRCTLARGGMKSPLTCGPPLRLPTVTCRPMARISPC